MAEVNVQPRHPRQDAELTQEQMANRLEWSFAKISRIEDATTAAKGLIH